MHVPFAGGSYQGVSPAANAQKCVNLYVENDINEVDDQGNPKKLLIGTPGLNLFGTMANTAVLRGLYSYNSLLYAVSGNKLYEVSTGGVGAVRGTLNTSTGPVYMADNGPKDGHQLMITDGTNGYIFDSVAVSFVTISDANFFAIPGPVIMLNNWFVVGTADNTDLFMLSKLGDGTTYTPLQEAEAEIDFDGITGLAADGQKLLILGRKSLEIWWNTGASNFPFQRLNAQIFHVGCLAAATVARHAGCITWLAQDDKGFAQIVRFDGGQPVVISTPDVEWQLRAFTTLTDAFAFAYHDRGHDFYWITFPTADATFVFDITTKEWAQRSTGTTGAIGSTTFHRHIANCYAFFNNKHYVGDFNATGKIYEMTNAAFTDAGTTIVRDRVCVHFNKNNQWFGFSRADAVFGGSSAGQSGVNANAVMGWSKDRGYTWYTGRVADETTNGMARWKQLGRGRDWLFWMRANSTSEQVVWTDFDLAQPGER